VYVKKAKNKKGRFVMDITEAGKTESKKVTKAYIP